MGTDDCWRHGGVKTNTAEVKKHYGVPPISPEEHNDVIDNLHTIVQGMQTQRYEVEELA